MGLKDWNYRSIEGPSTYDNDGLTPTITVPDRQVWQVLSLWVEYTASDTASTRQIRIRIQDDTDDVMLEFAPGLTVTASQTRQFHFFPGAPDLTAARDTDYISTPLPAGLILRPGWDIVVMEVSSGDTTDSDVMLTQLTYAEMDVISTAQPTPQTSD